MYRNYIKIFFDVGGAFILLLLVSPLFLIVGILLFLQNGGNTFFYQKRVGYQEKTFYIIKFKTMTDERDDKGELLPDSERITQLGNWIRKFSLDEMPQLINILKGDMSLIGPRPLLCKYIPLYSDEQRRRHQVKPGITGWAQVNGRNSISWARKFELDLYYIDNLSFMLDMKIIYLTILKVLKREGVNQSDTRPMQPFDGTN
jgi:lipopolysaccharide/colanic/teichoic acid biosynthesis glycosyltransferase